MPEKSARKCPSGSARTRAKKEGKKGKGKSDANQQIDELEEQIKSQREQLKVLEEELEKQRIARSRAENGMKSVVANLALLSRQHLNPHEQDSLQGLLSRTKGDDSGMQLQPRTDDVLDLLHAVVGTKRYKENSAPARCEQLERRITDMSDELARLVHVGLMYEQGLDELQHIYDVNAMHQRALSLKFERMKLISDLSVPEPPKPASNWYHDEMQSRPSSRVQFKETTSGLDLNPPISSERLCGSTHVKFLKSDLREYVIRELNMERTAGNDWRMFAERIGLATEQVRQAAMTTGSRPMEHVLTLWEQDPTASVRLLHRHLRSPQIRCHMVAKRISDFYDVD